MGEVDQGEEEGRLGGTLALARLDAAQLVKLVVYGGQRRVSGSI